MADAWLKDGSGLTVVNKICNKGHVRHFYASGDVSKILLAQPDAVVIQKPYQMVKLEAAIERAMGVEDHEHWPQVGRACQRFALQATALGLKTTFMNQLVEVAKFRPDLAALVGMPGRGPDIVMRFGYEPLTPYSARRQLAAVLI